MPVAESVACAYDCACGCAHGCACGCGCPRCVCGCVPMAVPVAESVVFACDCACGCARGCACDCGSARAALAPDRCSIARRSARPPLLAPPPCPPPPPYAFLPSPPPRACLLVSHASPRLTSHRFLSHRCPPSPFPLPASRSPLSLASSSRLFSHALPPLPVSASSRMRSHISSSLSLLSLTMHTMDAASLRSRTVSIVSTTDVATTTIDQAVT